MIAELDRDGADIEAAWRDLLRFIRDTPVVGALFERSRAHLGDSTAAAALSLRFRLPVGSAAAAGRRLPY